ncbi:MAG: alpha/beta hydrolase-fold protein [Anaerolineales bacterium]
MKHCYITAFLIALALLSACSPLSARSAIAPTGTRSVATTAAPPAAPTQTPPLAGSITKQTPFAQLTKETCLIAGGQSEQLSLASEFLDHPLAFRVVTPPCYAEHTDESYPVLYLIHGQTYTDDQWDRLGAGEAADALVAAGELPPFIIVLPADASHYTQPSANGFDEAVAADLLPWIDSHYRTIPDRQHRSVGGLSRGASWAIHLALTHPELFGALGGHSPPVFQEDASKVRGWLDALTAETAPRIWLDIGERDQRAILDSAVWFEGLLDERDLPHEWSLFTGDHSEDYWSRHVELYLRWYAAEW